MVEGTFALNEDLMVKRNQRKEGSGRPLTLILILLHTYTHIKHTVE